MANPLLSGGNEHPPEFRQLSTIVTFVSRKMLHQGIAESSGKSNYRSVLFKANSTQE